MRTDGRTDGDRNEEAKSCFSHFVDAPKRRHAVKRTSNRHTHTQNTHVSQVREP